MDAATWARLTAAADRLSTADEAERERILSALRADPQAAPHLDRFLDAWRGADAFAAKLSDELGAALVHGSVAPGQALGTWQLDRVIGWGGMGVVYRAHRADDQFDKVVAIKVMSAALASEADRARFLAERRILARLEHPAIARLIDAGLSAEGHPYYVLEHVEGVPADEHADGAPFEAVLDVFAEVCAAVSHAHANLVVHCDLKPSNVLVTAEGHAKLLDFGIARREGDADGETTSASTPLTRSYAAPELLLGQTVDTRADVYSLGVLLYRLVAGRQPYHLAAGDAAQVVDRPLPPLPRRAGLPELGRIELHAIIERATAPDRERRTPSVQHLIDQLAAWRAGAPLDPPPPGARMYRLRKLARRNPLATGLAAASVALALLTIGVLASALSITRAKEQQAREQKAIADDVIAFVERVFEEADPDQIPEQRGERTARELIESAAARLDHAALERNVSANRLELTIGRLAREVGAWEPARRLLTAVAEDPREPASARAAELALARLEADSGRRDAARARFDRALALCDAAQDGVCALEVLRYAVRNEVTASDPARAEALARDGLRRADLAPAELRPRFTADFTFALAYAAHGAQRWDESVAGFEQALSMYEALGDRSALEVAEASSMMADVKFVRGDLPAALAHMERARGIYVDLLGPRHPHVAYCDRVLSNVLLQLGRVDDAIRAAQESVDIRRERLGPTHVDTAESLTALARALLNAGRLPEALAAVTEARAITLETSPSRYHNAGRTLARVLSDLGQHDAAVATQREALAWYEAQFGPDGGATKKARGELEKLEAR